MAMHYVHKRYARWLTFLILAEMTFLVSTSLYLDPVVGDMTRLGGFAENDYGWNQPQKVFEKQPSPLQEGYDHYADIVVVGDSFSCAGLCGTPNSPWQTFLTAETGYSTVTLSHYTHTEPPTYDASLLPKIITGDSFQKRPPRILIAEFVERQLDILPDVGGDCGIINPYKNKPDFRPSPITLPMRDAYRIHNRTPLNEQLPYARKYWLERMKRTIKDSYTPVRQMELTAAALFSSKASNRLLVYEGDIKKKSWDEKRIADIQCKLAKLRNLVQQNGKTLFLTLIAPDKLSAYSAYLQDPSYAKTSVIDRLASDKSLHIVRVDQAMRAAVAEGTVDLYLPNDTHWGYRGHQTAAAAITRYLESFTGD